MTDDYFLSATNPIANVDQRELEDLALTLLGRPEIDRARRVAEALLRQVMAHPAGEQIVRLDAALDEYVFNYALRAVNSDGNHPKVLRIMQPAAHWFGRDVPGSRWGGDCPDFTYRIIPITHGARYEIRGRPTCDTPPNATYALMANAATSVMLGTVDSRDVPTDDDGQFVITVDGTAAEGRAHHLQTQPGESYVMIRDAIGDWSTVTPNALRVQRLDAPDRSPLDDDELAGRAARHIVDGVYFAYWCMRSGFGHAPNAVRAPMSSGPVGGLAVQWGSSGNLRIADDEAVVFTATAAGAGFRDFILYDVFDVSLDYWARQSSLNLAQAADDEDGRCTYVVAHTDPGVHNWLDPSGLHQVLFGHRWQEFTAGTADESPTFTCQTVKLDDLDAALPPGVRRVTSTERAAQQTRRRAGFASRFVDT